MKGCLKRSSSAPNVNQQCPSERLGQSQSLPRQRSVSQHSLDHQHNIHFRNIPARTGWRRWSTSTSLSPVSPGSPVSSQVRRGRQGGHDIHLVSTHFILHFMARIEVRMVRIKCLDVAGRRLGPAQQTPVRGDWGCGHQGDTDREQRPEGAVH